MDDQEAAPFFRKIAVVLLLAGLLLILAVVFGISLSVPFQYAIGMFSALKYDMLVFVVLAAALIGVAFFLMKDYLGR